MSLLFPARQAPSVNGFPNQLEDSLSILSDHFYPRPAAHLRKVNPSKEEARDHMHDPGFD
jgi:hypothetical protein